MDDMGRRIYEELGVRPGINAAGYMTLLGGSRPSARVLAAMEQAGRCFVDMEELLRRTGAIIAELLEAEDALVTPGCAAAITLGAAACLTGTDPERIERLPDTTGMKSEILIQTRQRYKYERCLTIPGARLVEVGDERGTSAAQLEAAISDRTPPGPAAVHYFASGGGQGTLPVEEVIRIAHGRGVPVLVDAAWQVYPLERLRLYNRLGADLVCYGAKYIGACNSTGILCGRRALVEAAFMHCFVGFEVGPYRSFGRPLKLARQEVVAVVAALREWLALDHEARAAEHQRQGHEIVQQLEGIPHVTAAWSPDERGLSSGVRVTLNEGPLGKTAGQIIQTLRDGNPSIWVRGSDNWFQIAVPLLADGEERVVAERVREALAG